MCDLPTSKVPIVYTSPHMYTRCVIGQKDMKSISKGMTQLYIFGNTQEIKIILAEYII